jgi:hypothetical protein
MSFNFSSRIHDLYGSSLFLLNLFVNLAHVLIFIALICLVLSLPSMFIQQLIDGPVILGAAMILWTFCAWLSCFAVVLDREQRACLYLFVSAKILSTRTKR